MPGVLDCQPGLILVLLKTDLMARRRMQPRDTGESEITLWIWKLRAIHGR